MRRIGRGRDVLRRRTRASVGRRTRHKGRRLAERKRRRGPAGDDRRLLVDHVAGDVGWRSGAVGNRVASLCTASRRCCVRRLGSRPHIRRQRHLLGRRAGAAIGVGAVERYVDGMPAAVRAVTALELRGLLVDHVAGDVGWRSGAVGNRVASLCTASRRCCVRRLGSRPHIRRQRRPAGSPGRSRHRCRCSRALRRRHASCCPRCHSSRAEGPSCRSCCR